MSRSRIYADVVAAIPLPSGAKRYQKVGVVLQYDAEQNDATKGPGLSIMIDKTFNPAGVGGDQPSVVLSVYWPKPKEGEAAKPTRRDLGLQTDGLDDDIPF